MKKIILLLLVFTTTIVFTSCKKLSEENSSDTKSPTSTLTDTYSELSSVEESSSSDTSSNAAASTPSEAQTSTVQTTTSSNTSVASSTPTISGCTHANYWDDHARVNIWGWSNRAVGVENKYTRVAKCEESREVIYKCPVCLEPVVLEILEPLGHDFSGEEEIIMYPSVNKEGSWGIKCKSLIPCFETKLTALIPKRGGSYETIDSCFTVDIDSDNNRESYDIDDYNISICDYRTWGSVPTIEFDTETYTGSISYVLQDGSLYKRNIYVDKTKMTEGVHYLGKILESGEYEGRYWALTSNGTGPS